MYNNSVYLLEKLQSLENELVVYEGKKDDFVYLIHNYNKFEEINSKILNKIINYIKLLLPSYSVSNYGGKIEICKDSTFLLDIENMYFLDYNTDVSIEKIEIIKVLGLKSEYKELIFGVDSNIMDNFISFNNSLKTNYLCVGTLRNLFSRPNKIELLDIKFTEGIYNPYRRLLLESKVSDLDIVFQSLNANIYVDSLIVKIENDCFMIKDKIFYNINKIDLIIENSLKGYLYVS